MISIWVVSLVISLGLGLICAAIDMDRTAEFFGTLFALILVLPVGVFLAVLSGLVTLA